MAYTTILVETEDDIATITLNRPQAMNAINSVLLRELVGALEEADRSDKVRCIVLTGSDKAFAAGADVAEMADLSFVEMYRRALYAGDMARLARIRKPIIAAVAGYALGGGCELAMACDIIIAADTAKFGQPEVNLGIMAGMGGSQRLTRAVGKPKAMDMHLTGRFMSAEEAERAGLVSRVVPARQLEQEARAAATKIAEKSQVSVLAIKDAVNRSQELPLTEGLAYERRLFEALFSTEDQAEGMAAFREKREPQYRDR
ncbi:short chain enoyl-CoA hydratase [Limimaricola soesokkakensis]|uniref:enoyl-CoA hydratase n=1 Tax=Limimaricola soesokkakensis TaxID=1343159 RepID=A0A1X6YMJ4_9RHOB|nr:enoyl-CoA hydratase-related protein [Limimaricola soesokkakensis]PSK88441.1 short chain enoyl-CoA hydratase [Limimaricola soesokkakensis]SLN25139.1 putative enoyl-CoA hydratase echA8 [Limimaricola soesokkakensis]